MVEPPLSQGVGYGVVVGVGFVFAIGMVLTTAALRRYQKEIITSEEFTTAGRSVKTGLIAAAVVSSWTWAATLLQSTSQAYKNGVSGPFWYASGATVQIILFATIAIELKKKAPGAHTYLEIVRARYGPVAHFTYLFFAVCTNILVTAMLLTGGSAVVKDLTGMRIEAGCFLLPLGVVVYTLFGGLKATFLTDYIHTIVILMLILVFTFTTYATSTILGSPGRVWEILTALAETEPIEGNEGGSYLTMTSRSGGIFFIINLAGNFGTVFLDNGYWNKAIAASPAAALPGYILGGFAWFAIPFVCATTMGIAALCLEGTPSFPTYPDRMSAADVSAGLVLPNAATALLGKGGAGGSLLLIFMAVTSASSAELIAVSSIFTYDIYKTYINPRARGKKLIFVTHLSVAAFGLAMAGFSIALYYINVSMGYLYLLMGVIISSAVIPACLTIMWKGQNVYAATGAPIIGFVLGLVAWLVTAKGMYGELTVTTTGDDYPMLAGNVVSLCSPVITVPLLTLIFGRDNYDFEKLKSLKSVKDVDHVPESPANSGTATPAEKDETVVDEIPVMNEEDEKILARYSKFARWVCLAVVLCFLILWPMPMYGSHYIFSKKFFTGWVVVGIIWIFFSVFAVVVYPLWESRYGIFYTMRGVYWDCTGQTYKLRAWQAEHPEALHHSAGESRAASAPGLIEGVAISARPSLEQKKVDV